LNRNFRPTQNRSTVACDVGSANVSRHSSLAKVSRHSSLSSASPQK
jgi:hypothetical protein